MDYPAEIAKWLLQFEKDYKIKILFAVESGSRAWGIASPDSDYDVRFVYIGDNLDQYILDSVPDTITRFSEDRLLDFGGWELRKAMRLLAKGNGSIVEWLSSPIVYLNHNNTIEAFRLVASDRRNTMHSFYGLSKSMEKHAYTPTGVVLKKYFYIIRPIAVLCWYCENFTGAPPLDLTLLLNAIKGITAEQKSAILELMKRKTQLSEGARDIEKDVVIEVWIQSVLSLFSSVKGNLEHTTDNTEACNQMILDIIHSNVTP